MAHGTDFHPRDLHLFFHAGDGFFKGQGNHGLQIGSPVRRTAGAAAAHPEPAEELLEQVAQILEPGPRSKRHAAEPGVAETVVRGAPLLVGKYAVSLVDFLEALLGPRFLIHVRVIAFGKIPVCAADGLAIGVARNPKDFIIITSGGHLLTKFPARDLFRAGR